jgi:hypothetical protein
MPCCIECIQTAEVGIVERCGKYCVARQRKAIVDGLKNSISDFTSNEQIKGASSKDVVDLLLITQYFDMLNAIGTRPDTLTVFIDEDGE